MKRPFSWILLCLLGAFVLMPALTMTSRAFAQQPTVSIPTVTASPLGPMVKIRLGGEDQINVRGGPGLNYPTVGVLVIGQSAPGLAITTGGDWVKITYASGPNGVGWVFRRLVDISGELPTVVPPPTPTPLTTPTANPTLEAQYNLQPSPTRLPTFTPAPPLIIPTFPAEIPTRGTGGVPIGLVMIALGVIGVFGTLISLLRGR